MATGSALRNYVKSFMLGLAVRAFYDKPHLHTMAGNPHLWQEFCLKYQNYLMPNNVIYMFLIGFMNFA